jgi:hypothetical protein
MTTYTFKITAENPANLPVGSIVEIEMKMSEYDEFKQENAAYLERYFVDSPAFKFDGKLYPDGRAMERMSQIQSTYPGAKDMFKNSRWVPKREW